MSQGKEMESRLPKPKFGLKKANSTLNMNTDLHVRNDRAQENKTSEKAMTNNSVNHVAAGLQQAKSTHNLASQCSKEMAAPPKRPLQRAKTHGAITRSVNTVKAGIKRPGTANEACENKRPNIRAVAKTTITSKVSKNTSAMATSGTNNATTSRAAPKPRPKWDLKGRLEEASNELVSTQERHKLIMQKNNDLQAQIKSLSEQELASKIKAEEFESKCTLLTLEVTVLQNKTSSLQTTCDNLSKLQKDLEDNLLAAKTSLNSYRETCKAQQMELQERTTQLAVLTDESRSQKNTIEQLSQLNSELQNMVHSMDKDRRQLHNAIQELKGNIRVFCRVRPKIEQEICKGLCSITFPDECTIEVGRSEVIEASTCGGRPRGTRQEFSFDKVFPPNASQAVLFEELSLLVQSALEGYNVCVFAYGQTGSGKTYTMEGYPGEVHEGMIPRTVRHIFEEKRQFEILGWEYRIEASFLEIYNEHIVDLLDSQQKTHEIRMANSKGTDIYVTNLRIEEVNSPKELEDCLKIAQKNRAVAATHSNERSSRSHSVARIRLIGTHKTRNEVCTGTLNLVDLAGSEKLRNDEVARTTETKNINKSLANLGNVILALLKKQDHVPYRNSKLTHLLMPSLGGNSKTLMLLNISPLDECYNETLNSLRFASNVNNCKTGNIRRTRAALTITT